MEAMIQWVEALLGNAYAFVIALVGLITVILRLLTRASVLHDRHVVLKVLERRRKLRKATVEGTQLANYLDTSIQTETFRIASGISASPQKMEYLLKLSSLGRWDDSQLRSISKAVVPCQNYGCEKCSQRGASTFAGSMRFSCDRG